MGGRRWGRSDRAYGVVATPSCLERAGLSRKVRNAGQRDAQGTTLPSHTCLCSSFAVPSPHLFLSRLGGAAGGRARGAKRFVRVCDCDKCDCEGLFGTKKEIFVSEVVDAPRPRWQLREFFAGRPGPCRAYSRC